VSLYGNAQAFSAGDFLLAIGVVPWPGGGGAITVLDELVEYDYFQKVSGYWSGQGKCSPITTDYQDGNS